MKYLSSMACSLILFGTEASAQELQSPYAMTVLNDHSGEERDSRARVQRLLKNHFEAQTLLAPDRFSSLTKVRSKTGFKFTKGRVYAAVGHRVETCLFISIPDREAFEAFVETNRLARARVV